MESVIQLLDILVMYPDSASPAAQTRFKGTVRVISRENQFKEEHAGFPRVLFKHLSDKSFFLARIVLISAKSFLITSF